MPRRLILPLLAAVWLLAPPSASAQILTPVDTFSMPIYATAPPGDGQRLFVVERGGTVRIVRDGVKLPEPFLDVSSIVDLDGEAGLLSLAFPPDYRTRGYFYVFLVPKDANPGAPPYGPIQVREYRRSADPERADPASGRVVLSVPHAENPNHYGGTLAFGPDGLLYVGTGDGGGGGDPGENAENVNSRLGKLLRLSPRPSGGAPFGTPSDNPFAGAVAGDDLVWSYGLRNPFRFSFDRATGDLAIGDVGQNRAEEIDFAPSASGRGRGANFQWDACEGPFAYPIMTDAPCTAAGTGPVHHYLNSGTGCAASITGGVVVRDPGYEALEGSYVYGDFCDGFMRSIQLATPAATGDADLGVSVPGNTLVNFAEDACGRVHVVQLSGEVSRLEDGSPEPCTLEVVYPLPSDPPPPPPGPLPLPTGNELVVRLDVPRRQRALRRGAVIARVRCEQACGVRALGRLSLRRAGRHYRLRQATRKIRARQQVTLRLRLSRAGRAALRRAHRRRRKVTARITVRARGDAERRLRQTSRTVRLVR